MADTNKDTKGDDKHFGMIIDLAQCIGCGACTVACKMENGVPLTKFNTWVESWDAGTYPNVARANLPKLCNHCTEAPCLAGCPVEATYAEVGGAIVIDKEKCIGCGNCVSACPYGTRYLDEDTKLAGKCTYCIHRTAQGLLPACVATCVTHARMFGDLNDPQSDIAQLATAQKTEILQPDIGLKTATTYIGLAKTMEAPACSGVFRGGNKADPTY